MADYTKIENWLYFGNNRNCNNKDFRNKFDRTIHIWRNDHPNQKCDSDIVYEKDLVIEYKDGHSLSKDILKKIFVFCEEFMKDFSGKTGKIYVHCHVGQTRSPTITLFINSIITGRHPASLLNHYYWRAYEQRKMILNICETPLMDIICYFENDYIKFKLNEITENLKVQTSTEHVKNAI